MGETIYGRPELRKDMGRKRFLDFYYLDTELASFCKQNGLDHSGDRRELIDRISDFLSGGDGSGSKFVPKHYVSKEGEGEITDDTLIERDFVYNDKHKEYFSKIIGPDFIMFSDFQIWLETNPGKTYGEAVNIWFLVRDDLGMY